MALITFYINLINNHIQLRIYYKNNLGLNFRGSIGPWYWCIGNEGFDTYSTAPSAAEWCPSTVGNPEQ